MTRAILLASSMLTLSACTSLLKPTEDTAHGVTLPAAYDYAGDIEQMQGHETDWWADFESPALDSLVAEALTANQSLAQGVASVKSARAALKVTNAGFLPQASGSLSSSSSTESGLDDISSSGRLSASYQLDLFGANDASRRSSEASLEEALFDQRALELTVQSDVASTYFSLLGAREQLDVARQNLEISERIFEIVQVRYRAGTISGFDVSSQEAQLANARATIPQIEAQITSLETALAILLGRTPQGYAAPSEDVMAVQLPEAEPGLPSDLLLRRPDLMRAEASLRGANASLDSARAAFFPSIDLGAGLSAALNTGADPVGSLSASLSQVIFSGGSLEGQLEGAEARREAQVASYRETILNALRDVDVSLKSIESNAARESQLLVARDAASDALDAAELRYRVGTVDLTTLLDAQQTYFDASDSVVQGRLDRLTSAIDLYVALGGNY